MRTTIQILLGFSFLMVTLPLQAVGDRWADRYFFRIIHVTPNGQGDGRTWKRATSLQRLVDDAANDEEILNAKGTVPCDQLWLSHGEHHLTKRLFANRDFHVSILGGFAGTETSAGQRDPEANPTTVLLDNCQFLFTRWAHHLTVDGLTLRGGVADYGGAIHIAGSLGGGNSIRIRNVDFVGCTARRGGGAIRVQRASRGQETRNLRIVDCRFVDCAALGEDDSLGGGAILIEKTSDQDFDGVLIRGCEFRGNRFAAAAGGGAVRVLAPHLRVRPVSIEYCRFEDNRCAESPPGGAEAVFAEAAKLVVKHCDFVGTPESLRVKGPGKHELVDNRFVASAAQARPIPLENARGPVWNGLADPGKWCYEDIVVSEQQRQRDRAPGAQYELYQPSIRYSMICEGQTPPVYAKYQHCAAVEHFEGRFFAVWQSNPTVHIEWARGRKIHFSTSEDFQIWSTPELIAPDLPHVGGTQPLLLRAPQDGLWCLWLCSSSDSDVQGMQISTLRPGSKTWSHRRMFADDRVDLDLSFYPQTNPWVLPSGRIIVPFIARLGESREPAGVFAYTDDDGATWQLSNWIRWPLNDGGQGIWEIHGSEQIDGVIRVFARNNAWDRSRPETALLTTTGTGVEKGTTLRFDAEVEYAGVQALQNRPQVFRLAGSRFCLLAPDVVAGALPWRTASLHFSRSGRNDYMAGLAIVPKGVMCSYPQGVAHNRGLYAVFTGEYPDDWRNIVGVGISPAPEPDRFYLWPRHRGLDPYVRSPAPTSDEVDGRRCVIFRGSGSVGVDTLPVDLAANQTLKLRLDVKVQAARPDEQSILLSFGDMARKDRPPIRIGGPSLAKGRLSVSSGADWREIAPFPLHAWHGLLLELSATHAIVRVDKQPPRRISASAGEMNPRLYLGEGVIVHEVGPSRGFRFAVDLASVRTEVD